MCINNFILLACIACLISKLAISDAGASLDKNNLSVLSGKGNVFNSFRKPQNHKLTSLNIHHHG